MLLSRIITAFILIVFLCETFDQSFITVLFYANQNNIAKNLCENRNKPQMHCNGKCQLQKKLNQNNKDKQTPAKKTESRNEVLSSKSFFASIEKITLITSTRKYFIQNINHTKDQSLSFFHPPQSLFM